MEQLYSRRTLLLASVLALPVPALAQQQPTPPEYYTLDERGVDLVSGQFTYQAVDVQIGPVDGGLAHGRVWANGGWRDTLSGTIAISGSSYVVSLGSISEVFTLSGSTFTPVSANGSSLSQSGNNLIFTTSDGTTATYSTTYGTSTTQYAANNAALIQMRRPNGEQMDFAWDGVTYCNLRAPTQDDTPGECLQFRNAVRVDSVRNNRGYQINYRYAQNSIPVDGREVQTGWLRRTGAIGVNLAVDYCDPFDNECTGTRNWPAVTYQSGDYGGRITAVTDQSNRTTSYSYTAGLSGVRFPGQPSDQINVTYANGKVASVTNATGAWNYAYVDTSGTRATTAAGPDGQQMTATANLSTGRATEVAQAVSAGVTRATRYQYDGQRRLTRVTQPEGNYTEIAYDSRGNVTQTTQVEKSGPGPSNITSSAAYLPTCSNVVICNQPTSTTDPRGNVTNYTYDDSHGGILTVTEPAPASGASRPQTRVSYTSQPAAFKNASGAIVASPLPITLPIAVSACVSGTVASGCAGTANEIVSVVSYATPSPANNLLPTTTTTRAGDNSLNATSTMTYTPNGDVETMDGPLTAQADITQYVYDDARQMTGMIGPDPDGAGPLLNRAMRIVYNPDSTISMTEVGTTTGQGAGAITTFASLQQSSIVYDSYLRPTQSSFSAAGTVYALNQAFYDASGRASCQALRMNPASFASAATCALSAPGAYGPDRISVTSYDFASRPTAVTSGFGTVEALTESVTYTDNGLPSLLTDGNGNVSALRYDGFDRPFRVFYPNASGGGVNNNDYTETLYDPASNVISSRTRSGATFTAAYDSLDRRTLLNAPTPASGQAQADSVAYSYDNLGRPLSASIPGGSLTSMTWDALSRQTTETGTLGTMAMAYDNAGRRTRLTWPDAFFVNYSYDPTGAMTAITQGSGASPISAYAYDNLGRRIYVARGNGVPTSYTYDPASRLTGLNHDVAGNGSDQAYGYAYNPANQIFQLNSANSNYSYSGTSIGTASYGINGRNQLTTVNGTSLTYDSNGNLTNDGTKTFTYDSANLLRSTTANAATLSYDALGRLRQLIGTSGAQYLYDGPEITGAYATGSLTISARLIKGPWVDELVVAYAGTDASAPQWSLQDHLTSVIAITSPTGAASFINRYDDYGVPQAGNAGRLQYTGQLWLPDFGVYYYKARAYQPNLGRFVQSDPIGYSAGMNLYAYVGGDPINFRDPSGLDECGFTWTYVDANGRTVEGGRQLGECPESPAFRWPGPAGGIFGFSGNGAGEATGGGGGSRGRDQCPTGGSVAISPLGFGATAFLGAVGVSGSAVFGVAVPSRFFSTGDWRGLQFFAQGSGAGLFGLGAFVGGGNNYGYAVSNQSMSNGFSPAVPVYQGGAGWGPGAEFSMQAGTLNGGLGDLSGGFQASGAGGPRGAFGAYVAGGIQKSYTLVTPPIGCSS